MAASKKPDVTRPVPTVTGPTKIVVPEAKEVTKPVRAVTTSGTRPFVTADVVSKEHLQAQKWRLLKRRRDAAVAKLQTEEERRLRNIRVRRALLGLVLFGVVAYGWRMLDSQHGNRWPLFPVWILMCVAVVGALGVMIWYIDWNN